MLRHCSIQELLDVRNGEGSLAARTHVDECQDCRDELDRVHQRVAALRALPALRAPRDRWPAVRERLVSERRRVWWMRGIWAAAATFALMLGANGLMNVPAATEETEPEIQVLLDHSTQLDSLLVVVAEQARVVSALTALAIVDLEDRISHVDTRIVQTRRIGISDRQREELRLLLQERVALMDALVNAHTQRVSYVGF
jgi:hypothetical protein